VTSTTRFIEQKSIKGPKENDSKSSGSKVAAEKIFWIVSVVANNARSP